MTRADSAGTGVASAADDQQAQRSIRLLLDEGSSPAHLFDRSLASEIDDTEPVARAYLEAEAGARSWTAALLTWTKSESGPDSVDARFRRLSSRGANIPKRRFSPADIARGTVG